MAAKIRGQVVGKTMVKGLKRLKERHFVIYVWLKQQRGFMVIELEDQEHQSGVGTMRQRNSGEHKNRLQYMENRLNTKNRKIKIGGSLAVL